MDGVDVVTLGMSEVACSDFVKPVSGSDDDGDRLVASEGSRPVVESGFLLDVRNALDI